MANLGQPKRAAPIRRFLAFARVPLLFALAFSIASNLLFLALPVYTNQIYSRVVISHNLATLLVLTVATLAAFVVSGVIDYIRSRVLFNLGSVFDEMVSTNVFEAVFQGNARRDPAGQSRSVRDLDVVRSAISGSVLSTLFDVPAIPLFMGALFIVDPAVGVVTGVGALILFSLAYAQDKLNRTETGEGEEASFRSNAFTEATVRNSEAVYGMGMVPTLREQWVKQRGKAIVSTSRASSLTSMFSISIRTVRMLVQICVVAASAILIMNRAIPPALMFVNMMLVSRALMPVQRLVGAYKGLVGAARSYDRLNRLLLGRDARRVATELPRPKGAMVVDGASYVAPGGKTMILKAISFRLEAGEVLGVLGPSGVGKTSLMRLLVGIWEPSSGQVRLDGHSVSAWDRGDFGRHVGYLPQETELFVGSVRDNIARFRSDVSDESVIEAARLAGAHRMILSLPKGYDTELTDNGRNLATGQRQKLGLARAVFGNPALVILDEPNSNLDAEGEHALVRTIADLKANGATVVVVSHRPSIFRTVDKLLLLRDGRVEAFGPRQRVLDKIIQPRPQRAPAKPGDVKSA